MLFIVGRICHVRAQHQHTAFHIHSRLRIVTLFEIFFVAHLHNPALGIREIVLLRLFDRRRRRLWIRPTHAFAAIPPRLAFGLLGQRHQGLNFAFKFRNRFHRVSVTDRCVLAGISANLRPVHTHAAALGQHAHLTCILQHLHETFLKEVGVLNPEGTDRVMVRMCATAADISRRHIFIRRFFDLPRTHSTHGVIIDQQTQHHRWRHLGAARSTCVHLEPVQRQQGHRFTTKWAKCPSGSQS